MGRRLRARLIVRWLLAALICAASAAALVERAWVRAQADTVVILGSSVPVIGWPLRVLTAEPSVVETVVAGQPATVARPPGGGNSSPAIVFVNGVTARGRHHPDVQRLARSLARAGYRAFVPDLPGLRNGVLSPRTVAATVAVARAAGQSVALFGVSAGASLALLAAEDPALEGRLTVVAGIAPYTDLREVVRLATTGFYEERGRLVRYDADAFVGLAVGRSLAASLPAPRLVAELRRRHEGDPRPLDDLPGPPALVRLLENRDPRRFDRLWAVLPLRVRLTVTRLSPLAGARRLGPPVLLASAPHDKYFPPAEARALARVAPHVDVVVTTTLSHAIPRLSLRDLRGLARFDAFVVRVLKAARRECPCRRQPTTSSASRGRRPRPLRGGPRPTSTSSGSSALPARPSASSRA